jgi:hypothetical protein
LVRNQNLRRGAAGARLGLSLGGAAAGAGTAGGSRTASNAPGDLGSRPLAEILQYIYGGDSGSKRRGGKSADASAGDVGTSSTRGSRRPPVRGPFFRAGSAGPTTTKAKKTTTGLSGSSSSS